MSAPPSEHGGAAFSEHHRFGIGQPAAGASTHPGLTLANLDLLEVNEAPARCWRWGASQVPRDESRVTINGGEIAMGHPLGTSGTRIAVTLLHEMQRRAAPSPPSASAA